MASLSATGRTLFVGALAQGLSSRAFEVTLIPEGGGRCGPFPIDRILANDQDPANHGRGEYVLSLRCVVPAGTDLPGPATVAELWHGGSIIYKTSIQPFRVGASHSSTLFLNFALGG